MRDFKTEVAQEIGAKPEQMSTGGRMVMMMIQAQEAAYQKQLREEKEQREAVKR